MVGGCVWESHEALYRAGSTPLQIFSPEWEILGRLMARTAASKRVRAGAIIADALIRTSAVRGGGGGGGGGRGGNTDGGGRGGGGGGGIL